MLLELGRPLFLPKGQLDKEQGRDLRIKSEKFLCIMKVDQNSSKCFFDNLWISTDNVSLEFGKRVILKVNSKVN